MENVALLRPRSLVFSVEHSGCGFEHDVSVAVAPGADLGTVDGIISAAAESVQGVRNIASDLLAEFCPAADDAGLVISDVKKPECNGATAKRYTCRAVSLLGRTDPLAVPAVHCCDLASAEFVIRWVALEQWGYDINTGPTQFLDLMTMVSVLDLVQADQPNEITPDLGGRHPQQVSPPRLQLVVD